MLFCIGKLLFLFIRVIAISKVVDNWYNAGHLGPKVVIVTVGHLIESLAGVSGPSDKHYPSNRHDTWFSCVYLWNIKTPAGPNYCSPPSSLLFS